MPISMMWPDWPFAAPKPCPPNWWTTRELAYLSYKLATIKTDVEMPLHLSELKNGEPDKAALLSLFKEMEFKTWIDEAQSQYHMPSQRSSQSPSPMSQMTSGEPQ